MCASNKNAEWDRWDYCQKKAWSHSFGVSEVIKELWGCIPKGKILVTTAGNYSLDYEATEFAQYLKEGVITCPESFMGVDDGSVEIKFDTIYGCNSIPEWNMKMYGPDCNHHIPFTEDRLQNYCLNHSKDIKFIHADLQQLFRNSAPTFVSIMEAMANEHDFAICFNSMFAVEKRSEFQPLETVQEGMLRHLNEHIERIPRFRKAVEGLTPLRYFWYNGHGKSSNSIMGSFVWYKP